MSYETHAIKCCTVSLWRALVHFLKQLFIFCTTWQHMQDPVCILCYSVYKTRLIPFSNIPIIHDVQQNTCCLLKCQGQIVYLSVFLHHNIGVPAFRDRTEKTHFESQFWLVWQNKLLRVRKSKCQSILWKKWNLPFL